MKRARRQDEDPLPTKKVLIELGNEVMSVSKAASTLASMRTPTPLNIINHVVERPFYLPLVIIMEEVFPHLRNRPFMLHSFTRTSYAWNLIFRSWCPIHNVLHSQQHWTIFQYHVPQNKDFCQWVMCFHESSKRIKLYGIPFYDELEDKKNY